MIPLSNHKSVLQRVLNDEVRKILYKLESIRIIRSFNGERMAGKTISIYGSTGSIGKQTLEVVRELGDIEVFALCCRSDAVKMFEQIKEFRPKVVAVINERDANQLKNMVANNNLNTRVVSGERAAIEACGTNDVSTVVMAPVGIAGLYPTLELIKRGKTIALANKETLVTGGELVMPLAKQYGVQILPVDSEHSAIFQALQGNNGNAIEKIKLTASGGPFRGKNREQLKGLTAREALKHPNWSMGPKVTIDSATLMNKGLEFIEARWLFDVKPEQIEVVVHPQSIIHSIVRYEDGSEIAQMGTPDMRTPIQYALTYPNRRKNTFPRLELEGKPLTFEKPDYETFKCLKYAIEALKKGGTFPTMINGANEQAVAIFLEDRISFLAISDLVESAYIAYNNTDLVTLDSIFAADRWAREHVTREVRKLARL
jgi:1-deoxy-D-xylulose-5-phosphate reductoisomerase